MEHDGWAEAVARRANLMCSWFYDRRDAKHAPYGGDRIGTGPAPSSIIVLDPRLSWAEGGAPERRQGNGVHAADSGCMVPYMMLHAEPLNSSGSPILP